MSRAVPSMIAQYAEANLVISWSNIGPCIFTNILVSLSHSAGWEQQFEVLSCEYCEQSLFCLKTCNATKPKQAAKLNAASDANAQLHRSPLDASVRLRSSRRTFKQKRDCYDLRPALVCRCCRAREQRRLIVNLHYIAAISMSSNPSEVAEIFQYFFFHGLSG